MGLAPPSGFAEPSGLAQPSPAAALEASLRERLVHQPLYLRGFWMGYGLNFDSTGQPQEQGGGRPLPGPLTLSGIEVESVTVRGSKLTLNAERVALVANAAGELERRSLVSTTLMFGTVQKQYRAKEMVKIIILADAAGSFDAALKAVFAKGLVELALVAPTYWRCYAVSSFAAGPPGPSSADSLKRCVERGAGEGVDGADTPATLLTEPQVRSTRQAAELGVSGESEVHLLVDAHGVPFDFQVVRPLGAGLDEGILQALAECRFKPATRAGAPVVGNFYFRLRYR